MRFKDWKPPYFSEDGWAYPGEITSLSQPYSYGWRCQYPEGLKLGERVDVGCFTYMNAKYGIEIGDDVQLGAHCAVYSDNTENDTHGPVKIGEGSLIGSYTLILPNTVIPPNSQIRAKTIIKQNSMHGTVIWDPIYGRYWRRL